MQGVGFFALVDGLAYTKKFFVLATSSGMVLEMLPVSDAVRP